MMTDNVDICSNPIIYQINDIDITLSDNVYPYKNKYTELYEQVEQYYNDNDTIPLNKRMYIHNYLNNRYVLDSLLDIHMFTTEMIDYISLVIMYPHKSTLILLTRKCNTSLGGHLLNMLHDRISDISQNVTIRYSTDYSMKCSNSSDDEYKYDVVICSYSSIVDGLHNIKQGGRLCICLHNGISYKTTDDNMPESLCNDKYIRYVKYNPSMNAKILYTLCIMCRYFESVQFKQTLYSDTICITATGAINNMNGLIKELNKVKITGLFTAIKTSTNLCQKIYVSWHNIIVNRLIRRLSNISVIYRMYMDTDQWSRFIRESSRIDSSVIDGLKKYLKTSRSRI